MIDQLIYQIRFDRSITGHHGLCISYSLCESLLISDLYDLYEFVYISYI